MILPPALIGAHLWLTSYVNNFLVAISGNNVIKCAFINWPSNNRLYSLVPLASLIGEISVCAVSMASSITPSVILFPCKKPDVFCKYMGTGPTPPAEIAAPSIIFLFIVMLIAEFTVAISRWVRLLTFSKWKNVFLAGNSNQIFSIYSCGFLSTILYPLYNFLNGNFLFIFPSLNTSCASTAKKKIVKSPIGEALTKFPPMVAILRIGVEETSLAYR